MRYNTKEPNIDISFLIGDIKRKGIQIGEFDEFKNDSIYYREIKELFEFSIPLDGYVVIISSINYLIIEVDLFIINIDERIKDFLYRNRKESLLDFIKQNIK